MKRQHETHGKKFKDVKVDALGSAALSSDEGGAKGRDRQAIEALREDYDEGHGPDNQNFKKTYFMRSPSEN